MMDYDVAIDSSQSFGRQGLNALGHSKHDKVKTCQQRKWSPQTAHVMAGNETTYQRNQAPGQFLIFLISSLTLGPLGPLALHGTTLSPVRYCRHCRQSRCFFWLLIVLDVLIAAPAAPGMEFLEQTEGTKPWYPAEHQ